MVTLLGWGSAHYKTAELTKKTRTNILSTNGIRSCRQCTCSRNGTRQVTSMGRSAVMKVKDVQASAGLCQRNVSAKLQFHQIVLSAKQAVKLTFLMIRAAARAMGRPLYRRPAAYTCLVYFTALSALLYCRQLPGFVFSTYAV
jgi:hypothetical protein